MKSPLSLLVLLTAVLSASSPALAGNDSEVCVMSHMGEGMEHTPGMDMSKMNMTGIPGAKLADDECANCHGVHGISTADDIPNLAGQLST